MEGWDASRVELHFVVIVVLVVLLVVARFFPSLFFSVIFLSSTERNIYIYINISSSKLERFLWKTLNTIEGLLLYYIYIYIYLYMLIYYCIIIMVFVKNVRKICEEREGLSYRLIYYDRKSGGREREGRGERGNIAPSCK